MDGLGLDIDEMLIIVLSLSSFVRGFIQSELAEVEAQRRTKLTEDEWRRTQAPYLQKIMTSGEFPLFTKVILDAALPHMDPDRQFDLGLAQLLDGIAARLDQRA